MTTHDQCTTPNCLICRDGAFVAALEPKCTGAERDWLNELLNRLESAQTEATWQRMENERLTGHLAACHALLHAILASEAGGQRLPTGQHVADAVGADGIKGEQHGHVTEGTPPPQLLAEL